VEAIGCYLIGYIINEEISEKALPYIKISIPIDRDRWLGREGCVMKSRGMGGSVDEDGWQVERDGWLR
jgi:hypothetical protein